jgi:hypothetical protein
MADLFLENPPFVIGKDHQVGVPVCNNQSVVIFLGEDFPQSCGKDDPAFGIYGMIMLTSEDGQDGFPPQ